MKTYPQVLSESDTLDLAATRSIARYGDGELRIAVGGNSISQIRDPKLTQELLRILLKPGDCVPCIPNIVPVPQVKKESWARYSTSQFMSMYGDRVTYGSSFITRPDSAPWIDTPEYWGRVRALWAGKDVTLVAGTMKSLRPEMMTDAASIRIVNTPRRDAYAEADKIMEEVGTPSGPVLLCAGATATVLAFRLCLKGIHALDLGHIGMFLRHAGAYRYQLDDLISPAYRALIQSMHAQGGWGKDGHKRAADVLAYADELKADVVLDYGCGQNTLAEACKPRRILGFDPGIPERQTMPKPCDLVVCMDVLEHCEPKKLTAVMTHMFQITGTGAYLNIATRPANRLLPNGANAHLIVESEQWWRDKVTSIGWRIQREVVKEGHDITFWCLK